MRTRDAEIQELLDATTLDARALRHNLRDIRRINWLLGWTGFAVREVARVVGGRRAFSLLDVASGSADIPLAIASWANRAHVEARIVATDLSAQIVAIAREQAAHAPTITVERQDALALSYPVGNFDIALCTLALHHFEPAMAVALLREMARVGRLVVVFDVARSRWAWIGSLLLTRLLFMNYMTRHDAPASVRRAYTEAELRALAQAAGLVDARTRVGFPFRLALLATGAASSDGR